MEDYIVPATCYSVEARVVNSRFIATISPVFSVQEAKEFITFVKNDGTIMDFCTTKCRYARLKYKKNPRKTRWTKYFGQQ